MTSLIKDPLLWILLVVLAAAVLAVLRARRTNLALRRTRKDLEARLGQTQGRIGQLEAHIDTLDTRHRGELADVRADAESATKAVLKSAMGTLQSLAEEQQLLLDQLLKKYGNDSEVLADLMSVDHTGSQFGRRAKGISVLCGGWLGRREGAATVYDVTRSAQGRIKDFNRVSIHAQASVAVVGKAVEPVAVVLAELLDNATTYSAPGTPVEVNIQAVPTGVCFIVDDAGLGMDQETKDRAAALLSADGPVDITGLGDPPRFGFAVCGMLANRYGFHVSVGSVSPYGGVRAVIRVPESLLSADVVAPAEPEQQEPVEAGQEDAPQRLAPVPVGPSRVVGTTSGGLPKRRRRQGPIAVVPSPPDPAALEEETSESSGEVTASRLGAFARGTQLGRTTNTTEGPDHQ
ncbi:ATP-binding protein [Streptomyces albogriseolus]|uniref:histidine kinase n=2 Tax=Streptomyces albogriseolus group TaxID=2867120 RepID=A0ABP6UBP7_9ACTN|nr:MULTISPECIES: ATP-binding protein [Streptomyces]MCX4565106.1 ATP-binding protein [Streptomyces viridodiastaticus]MCX4618357.1 ATP-binding protein [Streptomyces viridodiastaticus]GHB98279.1 sensor histidine kinase [Streptomyces albogriseolus]GHG24335.1 sensor histidine kinase [Streptomyces viridodiastaticus]